ncbi:MAG: adaptor protein MecA [Lachnospiraceae bacterium]|nr:adaptor protein MecA [Lachnospiraceae bacterium]
MKIERINDRQIKCTLTREDLDGRGVRLSEFAYGSKKARALFQDMMKQASYEVGFEAEDYPLMIEAVPMGPECLVLIVTQVDDPEELDTRFASFGPLMDEEDEEDEDAGEDYEYPGEDPAEEDSGVGDFYRMLRGITEPDYSGASGRFAAQLNPGLSRQIKDRPAASKTGAEKKRRTARIFSFRSLHDIRRAAARISDMAVIGNNTLYRDPEERRFYLCLHPQSVRKKNPAFVSVCALLAEYGAAAASDSLSEEYLEEHFEAVVRTHALQTFSEI